MQFVANFSGFHPAPSLCCSFSCPVCPLTFTDLYKYHAHLQTHRDWKPFKCDKCLKSFAAKSTLEKHSANCNLHVCRLCRQRFKKEEQYSDHMKSHDLCSTCDTTVGSHDELVQHQRTCGTAPKKRSEDIVLQLMPKSTVLKESLLGEEHPSDTGGYASSGSEMQSPKSEVLVPRPKLLDSRGSGDENSSGTMETGRYLGTLTIANSPVVLNIKEEPPGEQQSSELTQVRDAPNAMLMNLLKEGQTQTPVFQKSPAVAEDAGFSVHQSPRLAAKCLLNMVAQRSRSGTQEEQVKSPVIAEGSKQTEDNVTAVPNTPQPKTN